MRVQVGRQCREILQLQRAGISTASAELLLATMHAKIDDLVLSGNGTRQRFSGFSRPRQCSEAVLRMLVTGGPPVRGGGGMLQRIRTSSRSAPALRTTGAGNLETRPASAPGCRRCGS
jgi:hypothetical protein